MAPYMALRGTDTQIERHVRNGRYKHPPVLVEGTAVQDLDQHLGIAAAEEPQQARLT